MSERVTWETCPGCGHAAAVGWVDRDPVEFDCPRGCPLSSRQVAALFGAPSALPGAGD
ncbi:hypothetical protein [Geodermatophilus ruber]|uniref:hypothetical protein n=1 Tax=Geodermatophilus ruber TaxID=504800 RepID=UPI0015A6AC39|nr:hypothetical protein [Geodermatophilus ruber]